MKTHKQVVQCSLRPTWPLGALEWIPESHSLNDFGVSVVELQIDFQRSAPIDPKLISTHLKITLWYLYLDHNSQILIRFAVGLAGLGTVYIVIIEFDREWSWKVKFQVTDISTLCVSEKSRVWGLITGEHWYDILISITRHVRSDQKVNRYDYSYFHFSIPTTVESLRLSTY